MIMHLYPEDLIGLKTMINDHRRFDELLSSTRTGAEMTGSSDNFFIKPGYVYRETPAYFIDDTGDKTNQPEVYPFAAGIAVTQGISTIFDIGCGRGLKLANLYQQSDRWRITGIDYGPNIQWCRQHYSFGEWIEGDLEKIRSIPDGPAILICADVIEHLINPVSLLHVIRQAAIAGNVAVFSTPERDLTHGLEHMGPPVNICHTREWNMNEFCKLLEWAGFKLVHIGLTLSDDRGYGNKTILAVVRAQ